MNVSIQRRTDEMIGEIRSELKEARDKFDNRHTLAALQEEIGELAQAMIGQEIKEEVGQNDVYEEAVQAAAMAIRVATEGDQSFPVFDPSKVDIDMQLVAAETWAKMSLYQQKDYFKSHKVGSRNKDFNGTTLYQGTIGNVAVTGWKETVVAAENHAINIKKRAEQDETFDCPGIPIGSLDR